MTYYNIISPKSGQQQILFIYSIVNKMIIYIYIYIYIHQGTHMN